MFIKSLLFLTQKQQSTHDLTQVLDFHVARGRFESDPPMADMNSEASVYI
jgi:hypothetical protein